MYFDSAYFNFGLVLHSAKNNKEVSFADKLKHLKSNLKYPLDCFATFGKRVSFSYILEYIKL